MEGSRRVVMFENPQKRHVLSLQNWLRGNGCIAREETEFLGRQHDLISLSSPEDDVVSWLERLSSSILAYLGKVSLTLPAGKTIRSMQWLMSTAISI
jgi:hypothetical protein